MTIVIVGAGRIGSHLAKTLELTDRKIVVIDKMEEKLKSLENEAQVTLIHGDGADPTTLERAGAKHADVLIATTGDDEDNIIICQLAKYEFSVEQVIAVVNNPLNAWLFEPKMGIDVYVDVTEVLTKIIEERISVRDLITLLKLKGHLELVEVTVGEHSPSRGRSLAEIELPAESVVVGVIRNGEVVIPSGSTVLEQDDDVLAITRPNQEKELKIIIRGD